MDVRALHSLTVKGSHSDIAGRYADQGRFILTDSDPYAFPLPAEVPALMGEFSAWLRDAPNAPLTGFTAHLRRVSIRAWR